MTPRQQQLVREWREWYVTSVLNPSSARRWLEVVPDEHALRFARRWRTSEAAKARIARGEMWYQRGRIVDVHFNLHFDMEGFTEAMNRVQAHIESALGLPPEAVGS